MPVTFFDNDDSNSNDLEFAGDYLTKNPREHGKEFTIEEFIKAKSGKGYLVKTRYFCCWLWSKEKLAKQLIEALEYYVGTVQGFRLVVVLDKSAKNSYRIGLDDSLPSSWYALGNESYSVNQPSGIAKVEGNPFLKAVPISPLVELTGEVGGKGTAGKVRKAS